KRSQVLLRRLIPMQIPASLKAADGAKSHVPFAKRLLFAGKRLGFHVQAFVPTLVGALRWLWIRQQFGGGFIRYLAASVCFDLGMFVFVVLYNLYLVDLGFRENFMGEVAGAMTAGTLFGAVPAAWLARR